VTPNIFLCKSVTTKIIAQSLATLKLPAIHVIAWLGQLPPC